MPNTEPPSFHARLPASLLKRLKISAVENGRSLNAELVTRLEASFELGAAERGKAAALLSEALKIIEKG